MKILGQTSNGYIVNVTDTELANILGMYSRYDDKFDSTVKKSINENIDIPISNIYQNYYKTAALVKSVEYDKARSKLESMLEALKPIEDLLKHKMEVSNEDN